MAPQSCSVNLHPSEAGVGVRSQNRTHYHFIKFWKINAWVRTGRLHIGHIVVVEYSDQVFVDLNSEDCMPAKAASNETRNRRRRQ